jgi:hypothetical protein
MPAALPVGLLPGSCTLNGWMVDVNASATASTCTLDLLDGYLMPDNVPSALQITCRNGTIVLPHRPLAPCNSSDSRFGSGALAGQYPAAGKLLPSNSSFQLSCFDGPAWLSLPVVCFDGAWSNVSSSCVSFIAPRDCTNVLSQIPKNASMGSCSDTMTSGAACSIRCPTLFAATPTMSTCSSGVFMAQHCIAVMPSGDTVSLQLLTTIFHPPSQLPTSGVLLLQSSTQEESRTSSVDLVYAWEKQFPSGLVSPLLDPSAMTPILSLPPYSLEPGVWIIRVRVTDTNALHRSAADSTQHPTSLAEVSVLITPALQLLMSSDVSDPCASANPCQNGGVCVATHITSPAHAVQLSCQCPASTFGATCSLAVLACPSCASTFDGGEEISLYGLGMDLIQQLTVAGIVVEFSSVRTVSAAEDANVTGILKTWASIVSSRTSVQVFTFVSPGVPVLDSARVPSPRASAYEPMVLSALLSSAASPSSSTSAILTSDRVLTQVTLPRLLFYSASRCAVLREYDDGHADGGTGCQTCPTGCTCPGGQRCWPLHGYWNSNEFEVAQACAVPEACLGVDPSITTTSLSPEWSQNTAMTCDSAYAGTLCRECADGYYRMQMRCYPCAASAHQTFLLVTSLCVSLGVFVLLGLGVALFRARRLSMCVTIVLVAQAITLAGKIGASHLSGDAAQQAGTFFSYLAVINFDIELFRPVSPFDTMPQHLL